MVVNDSMYTPQSRGFRTTSTLRTLFLLALLIILGTALGPGYQPTAFGAPVALIALLWLARHPSDDVPSDDVARHSADDSQHLSFVRFTAFALPAVIVGSVLAYAGSFSTGGGGGGASSPSWKAVRLIAPTAVMIAVKVVLAVGIATWIERRSVSARIASLWLTVGIMRLFIFPVVWTAVWLLDYRWWNVHYGDFGNWHVALALLGWEPLTVGATTLFGAVSGGNFTIALAASVVVDLLGHGGVDANANASGEAASSEASATVVDNTNLSGSFQVQRVPRSSRTHYILATAYFVITLVTGSMYTTFAPTPTFFYQRPIGHFAPHYTQITCLIRGTLNSTAQHLASETDPSQRSKLVLWSETSITVRNETAFLQEAMALSERFDVHLGLAYALRVDKGVYKMQNKFTLIAPPSTTTYADQHASVALTYQKTKPVPNVESDVEPGSGDIAVANTTILGRMGAAICFDLNFPFLNQLSHNHVDIMLQPSATWGTIGDSHAFVNRLRAVEHGVTLVRCASNGVSGVFDAFHRVVGQQYTLGRGDGFVGRVPLYGRRVTAFAVWGELWGWTCVGATVVLLVLATAGPWRQRTYRGIILP